MIGKYKAAGKWSPLSRSVGAFALSTSSHAALAVRYW